MTRYLESEQISKCASPPGIFSDLLDGADIKYSILPDSSASSLEHSVLVEQVSRSVVLVVAEP